MKSIIVILKWWWCDNDDDMGNAVSLPESKNSCPVCAAEGKPVSAFIGCPRGECRLRDLPDGVKSRIRELRGCRHLRSHLYSMGFVPGTEVVVYGYGETGCRVQLRDICVVLDPETAGCILCDAAHGAKTGTSACRA